MNFKISLDSIAAEQYKDLKNNASQAKVFASVKKALYYMGTNLKHPSLNTHIYHTYTGPNGEKIFESYAQQKTPGAYRIFWYYGPGKRELTVIAIIPHPNN
jgi:hypothetical protein